MNKNSNVMIIGAISIIIITIIGFYNFQEEKIEDENNTKEIEISEYNPTYEIIKDENNTKEIEISEYNPTDEIIKEKLEDIEKGADENYFQPSPREWIRSGPFEIDRSKYHLGEKVFLRIGELYPDEKGQIAFVKQTNATHYTVLQIIPFDGQNKPAFNYYTDIKLLKQLNLCTIEDIVGEWQVVFRGTDYPNIKFEVLNEFIPGQENSFEPVC